MKRLLVTFLLLAVAGTLGAFHLSREWQVRGSAAGTFVDIHQGLGAREIVQLLEEKKVITNRYAAMAFVLYSRTRNKLQAGEYLFDHPQTIPEVIGKLASGTVYLRKFTVPEGLTISLIAGKWEEQGFGTRSEFLDAATAAVELARRFDQKAISLEGYLFPETYSFPRHTTARHAIEAMVERFQRTVKKLEQLVPAGEWPLNAHDTLILASLVESEAAQGDERPLVASVYLNRLRQKIPLQCDPTVIYALQQADRYRGRLTVTDLQFKSPYNTYVNAGLPPGPIANPGYASLLAAVQPATTKYLYFVRTTDSRHVFSETLAAHNRAVSAYRRLQKRRGKAD